MGALQTIVHETDFCVVGGGLAGVCAAVAAARHGSKVVLMQDRPMLGGNASSEIRMWISGAHGENNRETGILEELVMENQYRNPYKNYSVWDSVIYGIVRKEKGIKLLLNCSCMDAEMDGDRIVSITGWQTTTQKFHKVKARIFSDCSGDSILAPLTGAPFRMGREAGSEFGETIAPEEQDRKTMGMSCLMQGRETDQDIKFIPPDWAEKISDDQLNYRHPNMSDIEENFWYLELGGEQDSIADTEDIRDELVALAYGMWDYIKNDPKQKEKNKGWMLDWVGMLPGKRESRRYVGAHIMTENDVRDRGQFDDIVAYGGWTMDDHNPAGFRSQDPPNIFHPAPSPFGIPYRCLYSQTIPNLFFAGRNISVTHAAFSSIRVMATCALCGQAVGTAAAIALRQDLEPSKVPVKELQWTLMDDDCYLPGVPRPIDALTREAHIIADGENIGALTDGMDRPLGSESHYWKGKKGDKIRFVFDHPVSVDHLRCVFDSDLMRETLTPEEKQLYNCMYHNIHLRMKPAYPPHTLIRKFNVTVRFRDGQERLVIEENNNFQRLRKYLLECANVVEICFEPLETWGTEEFRLFSLEVCGKGN